MITPPCVIPVANIQTNGDLLNAYLDGDSALKQCAAQKQAVDNCLERYKNDE